MLKIILFIGSVLCNSVIMTESARILAVVPTPSISHQVVFRPLTQELARRGHTVVVLTTDPAFPKGKTPTNLTEIDLHDISYKVWRENFLKTVTGDKNDLYLQIKTLLEISPIMFEKQIRNDEVQRLLHNKTETFDLLLIEACVSLWLVLSYIYKAPVIQVSSLGAMLNNYPVMGIPTHPLLYPNIFNRRVYNLTYREKIAETYNRFSLAYLNYQYENKATEILRRIISPDVPTLSELNENVGILFLNLRPIWEGNYPVPPNVIYIGGMHQNPAKELPQDLKTFLDSSKHGVIYMSFGTNMVPSTLPADKIRTFVNTFSELPYDILWKWDKDELPGQTKNIRIGKWFPQSDLLKHPKMKLFITQGGLQSTDEAIAAGVPLIGIPMLGDQWFNTEKYVFHKIGVRIEIEELTEANLKNAIHTVINDESYIENVKRLRRLMRDEPTPPLDRAVWWVEHVLRNGARHLRSPAHNISWSQYLELELVFFVLTVVFLSCMGILAISYFILKFTMSKTKIKKS